MNNNQIPATGASCKESRELKTKCEGMTLCATCTERGPQDLYPFGQLSRVGSEQHTQPVTYHRQHVESGPARPNPVNTRERPLSSGDPKDLRGCCSIITAQPCKVSSHWLEDNYPAKRDLVPIFYPNGALAQGMDTSQARPEGRFNQPPLPFETVYTPNIHIPPLLQSIYAPTPSNTASDVYGSGSGQAAQVPLLAPSLESRQPSRQVSSRRSDLRFSKPYDRIYCSELAFPYPPPRRLVAGSSWESEIGRQPPSTSGAQQFNGLAQPLSREDVVLSYTPPSGSMAGSFTGSEFGWAREERVYGQVCNASSKGTSYLRATLGQRPAFSVRARIATGREHYPYQDDELRRKYPKERQHALELAIGFQKEHGRTKGIPPDLLDKLLEKRVDKDSLENRTEDKYYCFCCPDDRKARTITPARDHVRKSLGNFPFRCLNPWCRHSSLRQADLNKHKKTCINPASSAPQSSTSAIHNLEFTGSMMQDQASVDPQFIFNVNDSRPDDGNNTYTGPPSAARFGTQNYRV